MPRPAAVEQAREEMLIAEGSDWFWWYGDDHSSDHDREFDDLFRRHLRNAYRLLQKPVPDELFVSNISTARRSGGISRRRRCFADHRRRGYELFRMAGRRHIRRPVNQRAPCIRPDAPHPDADARALRVQRVRPLRAA